MEDSFDLEREREELLRFINERADAVIRLALKLVPEVPRSPEIVTTSTSTEGTGYASKE